MCAHILAVTHVILKAKSSEEQKALAYCNLKLMGKALVPEAAKKGGKWLKGKPAAKKLHYLHRDSDDDVEDESEDEW